MPNETLRKYLLLPLSKIYGFGVAVRNKLYDIGWLKQNSFDIPIITIGNIAVGGTGKTPHTEYIVRMLRHNYNIGILSRGYKRKTKGFVLATPHTTPRDIGDEPYQMYQKFGRNIMVAVCENRTFGIEKMLEINPDLNLIVLDDGFQHRRVRADVSILLTEFQKPYYNDNLLPYGNLRESKKGIVRADLILVTKCPVDAPPIEYRIIQSNLNHIPDQGPFFTRYRYESPRPLFPSSVQKESIPKLEDLTPYDKILMVCGIANPKPFHEYIKSFDASVKVCLFEDHHDFTRKDMESILNDFMSLPKGRRYIFTTEKDAVRLLNNPYFPHQLKPYTFFIPVRVAIDETQELKLRNSILRLISNKKRAGV